MSKETASETPLPIGTSIEKIEDFLKQLLDISQDKSLRLSSKNLDHPEDFLQTSQHKAKRFKRSLKQLSYHGIFLRAAPMHSLHDYSTFPENIEEDALFTLILFPSFGEPQLNADNAEKPEALAVCGFNIGRIVDPQDGKHHLALNILQRQTAKFENRKEQLIHLGFFKYQDLFVHYMQQLSLYLKNNLTPDLKYVSIAIETNWDDRIAKRGLDILESLSFPAQKLKKKMEEIKNKRIKWTNEKGFTNLASFQQHPLPIKNTYHQSAIKHWMR